MKANPFWNGLRDFSERFDAEMLPDLDRLTPGAEGSVLITIPYLPYQDNELKQLTEFVRGGGTLLILDDYGYGNQVLQALGLGMEYSGYPLLDPYINYRNQWFPLVTDLATELKDAGVEQLILNHATALSLSRQYEVLANSSDMSFIDRNGNASWSQGEPRGPFVVAARAKVAKGMVVAISDPSILINSMVGRGDNNEFLNQIIAKAGEKPWIVLDTSHLSKTPLDRSKDTWAIAREQLALPYSQVLLVGAVLTLTFMPVWRKGVKVEREE
jgi:hypothetical protein